jgi:CubicO group peptidase (beta-lactamase class C family)
MSRPPRQTSATRRRTSQSDRCELAPEGDRRRKLVAPIAESDRALVEACESYAHDALRATHTPGLSVALARGGRVIWSQAFGVAELQDQAPMTIDSTFPGGSFGKTLVAVAVMQLVEQGLVDLYAPARRYMPELPLANPLGEREITVYDLLTYRSGLALDIGDQSAEHERLADYISRALCTRTRVDYNAGAPRWIDKVGASYHYSSLGIAILGHLVAKANSEGLSFAEYVARHISDRLELDGTGYADDRTGSSSAELTDRRCCGYARFGPTLLPTPMLKPRAAIPNGLLTTPADYARVLLALLQPEFGEKILKPRTARLMITPQVEMTEMADRRGWWAGIGVEMTRLGCGDFSFGHGGVQPWGWWSLAAAFPEHDTVIAAFSNRWDMPRWYNPELETAPGLLVDFVRRWLTNDPGLRARGAPRHSWAWRASWVMGFSLAERTVAMLGADGAIDEADIESVCSQAVGLEGGPPALWDGDGFCAGVRTMLATTPTATGVRDCLASGEAPVTSAELPLVALALGQRGSLSLPHPYFARAAQEGQSETTHAMPLAVGRA